MISVSKFSSKNTDIEIEQMYIQLIDTYQSSDTECDSADSYDKPSTSGVRKNGQKNAKKGQEWQLACRDLLEKLWQDSASRPFRYFIFTFLFYA